jgi:hypothetical protein
MRRRHGFRFRLASRVRFFDGPRIRCNAALGPHFGLPLHFGTLKRYACGIAIGLGAGSGLGSAGGLCRFSGARCHERSPLGFGSCSLARRFGRFGGRFRGRVGGRYSLRGLLAGLLARLVRHFFAGTADLLCAAGDFAPGDLRTAYVL